MLKIHEIEKLQKQIRALTLAIQDDAKKGKHQQDKALELAHQGEWSKLFHEQFRDPDYVRSVHIPFFRDIYHGRVDYDDDVSRQKDTPMNHLMKRVHQDRQQSRTFQQNRPELLERKKKNERNNAQYMETDYTTNSN